jgi:hypothetical protein
MMTPCLAARIIRIREQATSSLACPPPPDKTAGESARRRESGCTAGRREFPHSAPCGDEATSYILTARKRQFSVERALTTDGGFVSSGVPPDAFNVEIVDDHWREHIEREAVCIRETQARYGSAKLKQRGA